MKHLKQRVWSRCVGLLLSLGCVVSSLAEPAPVRVNRTVPQVEPPRPVLQFSPQPAPEEFFHAHIFQEPLVPVGGEPTTAENADLAAALLGYAHRSGPDDFSSLTEFLEQHPQSSWNAALLTDLGLEYYNTAHYSLAIDAWSQAWALAGKARDAKAVALVQRAYGELLRMNSRLGRMDEVQRLLNSTGLHAPAGQADQRVVDAREALWDMKNRPQIAFRCGPLALRSIRIALGLSGSSDVEIFKSASTQKGCSLPQVAELSRKIGLNYQMAFRNSGEFVVPSVVHWKVGHYAALIRQAGDLYELQDPTFGNSTWATRQALEAETSGYFLIASRPLPEGWRTVDEAEGATVWGKGIASGNSGQHITRNDLATGGSCPATGMAVPRIHLMDVNLSLVDNPLGYAPPVGPAVKFVVRYNQRDSFQPANFTYGNLGPQWTTDWYTYITDNPANALADVNLYVGGGGQRTYIGFDNNTQSFAYQQYDRNLLTRTGPASYTLLSGDGSQLIFSESDGSVGTSRNIFLTQEIDPQGNAISFTYDNNLCLAAVTDAIGQVTTLTYGLPSSNNITAKIFVPADPYKLTSVTDPFGRTAIFSYVPQLVGITNTGSSTNKIYAWGLASTTDVIGLTSQYGYHSITNQTSPVSFTVNNFVNSLATPYGTTSFSTTLDNGTTRSMEITYPDYSHERVEFNQTVYVPPSDPPLALPAGMLTHNEFLQGRNTFYWDRNAYAQSPLDYTKARLFHWLHMENGALTAGALESVKQPLENRVWYDYAGQIVSQIIASNTLPAHIGRALDDGSTQLYTYAYNSFGHITNCIDPVGRTLTYIYDTNEIDLLEVRQTRLGQNELLAKVTYNSKHRPLTATDSAGQTTKFSYNSRGQLLTVTDPINETATATYDTNGYLLSVDGPLPGTNDVASASFDSFGRLQTIMGVSGYKLAFNYDALDRPTRVTFPDGTFTECYYNNLDCMAVQDRAQRLTSFTYDSMRQLTSTTDPLNRTTLFEWCRCGSPKSITDPMGRITTWTMDVQGRKTAKQYSDGSQVNYVYENFGGRLRQITDEKQETTFLNYNPDNTIQSVAYGNAAVPTPNVTYIYDPNYVRLTSMQDGIGTTTYSYLPITPSPGLGAGQLASVNGPLTNTTIAYAYDELGRQVQRTLDGAVTTRSFDAAGRVTGISNELGAFVYNYDGSSERLTSEIYPNGRTTAIGYGNSQQDFAFQQISNVVGTTPISQFSYSHDIHRGQITEWSQQAGSESPSVFTFGYDAVNQLISAVVTNSGTLADSFGYSYDPAGNRLTETITGLTSTAYYNTLNQLATITHSAPPARTNEWDAQHRLTAVNQGDLRTEFAYDGLSRLASIRQLQSGSQVSFRRFVWCHDNICEERDASGTSITKRFYMQGVALETGTNAGVYYYSQDHLGSVRELTDTVGNVRARFSYDLYGRKTKVSGDLDSDFGFTGMLWSPEANLALTRFRAYDPAMGRWLSRDPLPSAEFSQGPNLYAYVHNSPVSQVDPLGLLDGERLLDTAAVGVTVGTVAYGVALPALDSVSSTCFKMPSLCIQAGIIAAAPGVAGVGFAIAGYNGSGAGAEPVNCSEYGPPAATEPPVEPTPAGDVIEMDAMEPHPDEAEALANYREDVREHYKPLSEPPGRGGAAQREWNLLNSDYEENFLGPKSRLFGDLAAESFSGGKVTTPYLVRTVPNFSQRVDLADEFVNYLMFGGPFKF